VWCNFPACGAEHRARLLETLIAPLLMGRDFSSPLEAYALATQQTAVLAIQSGEPGPLAQVIAGVDLALWDLCARRAAMPLYRLLGGSSDSVPVYASGINPDQPQDMVAAKRSEGYRAFKLKVGFGESRDLDNIQTLRSMLGHDEPLMLDANQAWSLEAAAAIVPRLEAFGIGWLEEPLRADRPAPEWQRLRALTRIPLAAGENMIGHEAFARAIDSGALSVVQPDIAKWGGISGVWPVIQRVRAAGLRFCPHYLGAGVGLLGSAHVLAAAGGDGMLEVDANPNLLRSRVAPHLEVLRDGRVALGSRPGIGVEVDLDALRQDCEAAPRRRSRG
jgi:L-alanine-DL-glutamate epimerase-like enolase superfamily enzyme